ncbi:hypothetical protein GQ457_08G013160 [Hibiscus cannabinus]
MLELGLETILLDLVQAQSSSALPKKKGTKQRRLEGTLIILTTKLPISLSTGHCFARMEKNEVGISCF